MEENIYELQFTVTSLRMLHKAVTYAHKHWPGGEPIEQEYYAVSYTHLRAHETAS